MVDATAWGAMPQSEPERIRPPSMALALAEGRALAELALTLATRRLLMMAPKGDGHPVLVLPGLLASDRSTVLMRRYLTDLGYDAYGWGHGQNFGRFYRMREVLGRQVDGLYLSTGAKVSIVGWSMGGVFARYLALTRPDKIRRIVTLGSPFSVDINASNASKLYEAMSNEGPARVGDLEALAGDLPVPNTSVYTKLDGIVNWRTSIPNAAPNAEAVEIRLASHVGLGVNPAALWAIADRLALKDGVFAPFARNGPFAMAYGG